MDIVCNNFEWCLKEKDFREDYILTKIIINILYLDFS